MTFWRVSIQGDIGTTGEVWSVNPAFSVQPGGGAVWNQEAGDTAAAAVAAVTPGTVLNGLLSGQGAIKRIRLELREGDNTLLGVSERPYTGTVPSGTISAIPQTAVVLSLRTNTPGASGRGRLYWPALSVSVSGTTGRLTSSTTTAVATQAATYLRAVQDAVKNGYYGPLAASVVELCVFSPKQGTTHHVNRIQVGDVLDVQRRRRDRLREVYAAAAFPGS